MSRSGCAIILAAGTSSRMGKPKQLLELEGKCILERVINQVMKHPFERVIIILGHRDDEIRRKISIDSDRVTWVNNPDYLKGQSTSLLVGLNEIPKSIPAATVFLGDQPFISESTISEVNRTGNDRLEKEGEPFVIRPFYKDKPGHPVYWGNIHQLHVPKLTADRGGLQLMKSASQYYIQISDPFVFIDVDTPKDFTDAKRMSHYLT